jgi:hypothetical protein
VAGGRLAGGATSCRWWWSSQQGGINCFCAQLAATHDSTRGWFTTKAAGMKQVAAYVGRKWSQQVADIMLVHVSMQTARVWHRMWATFGYIGISGQSEEIVRAGPVVIRTKCSMLCSWWHMLATELVGAEGRPVVRLGSVLVHWATLGDAQCGI